MSTDEVSMTALKKDLIFIITIQIKTYIWRHDLNRIIPYHLGSVLGSVLVI